MVDELDDEEAIGAVGDVDYRLERFAKSCDSVVITGLMLFCASNIGCTYAPVMSQYIWLPIPVGLGFPALLGCVCARRLMAAGQVMRAHLYLSRAIAFEGLLGIISLMLPIDDDSSRLPLLLLISSALFLSITCVAFWLLVVSVAHQMVWSVSMALVFIMAAPFSEAGRPTETICMISAMVIGQLAGFIIDKLHRDAYFQTHVQILYHQARAARAEGARNILAAERGADSRLNHLIKSKVGASLQLVWLLRQAFREERLLPPMSPSSHGLNGLQTRQESPPQPQPQPQPQTQTQTQTQQHQQQQTAQQSMTSMLKRHDAHLKMIAEQLETVIDWVHRRQV